MLIFLWGFKVSISVVFMETIWSFFGQFWGFLVILIDFYGQFLAISLANFLKSKLIDHFLVDFSNFWLFWMIFINFIRSILGQFLTICDFWRFLVVFGGFWLFWLIFMVDFWRFHLPTFEKSKLIGQFWSILVNFGYFGWF